MQQHTGQHLLSAVFADLFGFETVAFTWGPSLRRSISRVPL